MQAIFDAFGKLSQISHIDGRLGYPLGHFLLRMMLSFDSHQREPDSLSFAFPISVLKPAGPVPRSETIPSEP